jgi:radical SAM protein with 4Fe4S-binding SPASM domain
MKYRRKLNLLKQMASYKLRQTKVPTWPQISSIEVTNDCNLRCLFCARSTVEAHRGIGYMPLERFQWICRNYGLQMQHPRLFLHGEPTLHPNLVEMIRLCRRYGARSVGFTTNGILLTANLFARCAEAGLSVVSFSFEGTTQQVYKKLRGPHYDVVKKNILDCCRMNHRLNLGINISINIIDNTLTHNGLHRFIDEWESVQGCNGVTVSQCGDWVKAIDTSAIQLPALYKPVPVCPAAWYLVVIYWNGDIAPCCVWNSEPFGNIYRDDLLAVWNSPRYVAFRETMLGGRQGHSYCKDCCANPFPPDSPYLKPRMAGTFLVKPIQRRLR